VIGIVDFNSFELSQQQYQLAKSKCPMGVKQYQFAE
jgi:hypothetical protein